MSIDKKRTSKNSDPWIYPWSGIHYTFSSRISVNFAWFTKDYTLGMSAIEINKIKALVVDKVIAPEKICFKNSWSISASLKEKAVKYLYKNSSFNFKDNYSEILNDF